MVFSGSIAARSRGPGLRLWRRYLLAFAVAAQGVINLLSAYLSHPPERLFTLRRLVPTEVIDTSRTFTVLTGLLLLVTAWGLRSGKRRAFVAALFLCAVSVPVNLLKAFDFEEATAASTLMFLLAVSSESFRVKSRELTLSALWSDALIALVGFAAYAIAGCWIVAARFGTSSSLADAAREALYRVTGLGSETLVLQRHLGPHLHHIVSWFLGSLPLMAGTLVVLIALAAIRPVAHRSRHRAEAHRVATLLRTYGDSTVSFFALADDTDYFFNPNGRAVIAYRFESNALLVIGDPIGPQEELPSLLHSFAQFCREHDWAFAFFQVRPERLPLYESLGWRAIHIGEDPVIFPDRFSLEGSAMGDVRRSTRKMEEAGWEARHYFPGANPLDTTPGSDEILDQLRQISAEWMKARHGEEKGFCMGRFQPERLHESWVAVAWNREERKASAFISWVPVWARQGWGLDLMRRSADAPNGTMEFLIAKSVEKARERGDHMLSLSLYALAKVEQERAEAPDRVRSFLMEHLARFYDFGSLFQWKRKFAPRFEDRYLVYPDPLALPRVVLALARAQSPGGLRSYFRKAA